MSQQMRKWVAQTGGPLVKLHVLGAAGCVSGSLNLIEYFANGKVFRFLLDVGLHQENLSANKENRLPKNITPADIDAVIISHAHIDHTGWLPALVKQGFRGPVYTHYATKDLMEFMLTDSAHLQEVEASRINRSNQRSFAEVRQRRWEDRRNNAPQRDGGNKRHSMRLPLRLHNSLSSKQVKPLYTADDARRSMEQVQGVNYGVNHILTDGIYFKFTQACHILGAAVVTLEIGKGGKKRTLVFSGNIGRPSTPILKDLEPVLQADYLICESTYGDRRHEQRDRLTVLEGILKPAIERAATPHPKYGCGVIIIPAFAVGRVQAVLYDIRQLMDERRIPVVPLFVDSPMANLSTAVHRQYVKLYNEECRKLTESGRDPFSTPQQVEVVDAQQSMQLDGRAEQPIIIIGSSGMAAGGRILKHLEARLPGKQNTVLFVGYQGTGTLGRALADPEQKKPEEVRIFGRFVPARATIEFMSDYSGHADYEEIVSWLSQFKRKPKNTFLVHGDSASLTGLKAQIERRLGWKVAIPQHRQCFILD